MDNLKRLWPYVRPHRSTIALTMVCMALSGALGTGFLLLMQKVLEPMLDRAGFDVIDASASAPLIVRTTSRLAAACRSTSTSRPAP